MEIVLLFLSDYSLLTFFPFSQTDNAHSDRDLCDRPGEAHQRHRKRAEKEKHKSEDKDRINHENDGKDLGRDSRDENMRRKRKSCQRVNYRVVEPMYTSGENTENFGIYSASDATHNNKNALKSESIAVLLERFS